MGCNSSKQVEISPPSGTKPTTESTGQHGGGYKTKEYQQTTGFTAQGKTIKGDLYVAWPSAPCRAVLMTCAALEIRPNFKALDIFKGETKTPEFAAINPLHSVPTYVDGDFKLWESRAIMSYFVGTAGGKDHPLYPSDFKKRAMIDNVLNADHSTFYKAILAWIVPQFPGSTKVVDLNEKANEVKKALTTLEEFYLKKNQYVAGSQLTIADFSVVAGITFLEVFDYDLAQFPKISEWLGRMKKLSYFEKCNAALYKLKEQFKPSSTNENKIPGDLYVAWPSAPCRAIFMACGAMGMRPNFKPLDLQKGEHKKPEFTAINPNHTVPTYVDGDFKLWESRAILCYLVTAFGKQHQELYPSDLEKRAMVDNVLNTDHSLFSKAFSSWVGPQFPGSTKVVNLSEKAEEVKKALTTLDEHYLAKNDYVAGPQLTIADFSVVSGVTLLELFDYDISQFSKITGWVGRMKKLPYFEKCNEGLYKLKAKFQQQQG